MLELLSNIRNFVEGNYYHLLHQFDSEPVHIKEQALLRMSKCPDCLTNLKCGCGCTVPNLFYSPNKEDHQHRWTKMLSPEDWHKFKLENKIDDTLLAN